MREIARGEAECYICLKTTSLSAIFASLVSTLTALENCQPGVFTRIMKQLETHRVRLIPGIIGIVPVLYLHYSCSGLG